MKHIKPFLESNNEYYQELDQAQFIRYIKDYDKRIPFDKNTYEKIKSLFSTDIENKNLPPLLHKSRGAGISFTRTYLPMFSIPSSLNNGEQWDIRITKSSRWGRTYILIESESIDIVMTDDEWFYLFTTLRPSKYYRCDQFEGLKKLINDINIQVSFPH